MCAFSHTWSVTSGHVTKMAVTPFDVPYQTKDLHCGNRDSRPFSSCDFDTDLHPWPSYTNLARILPYSLEIYRMCTYKLLRQDFQKLSSDRQTWPKLYSHVVNEWHEDDNTGNHAEFYALSAVARVAENHMDMRRRCRSILHREWMQWI